MDAIDYMELNCVPKLYFLNICLLRTRLNDSYYLIIAHHNQQTNDTKQTNKQTNEGFVNFILKQYPMGGIKIIQSGFFHTIDVISFFNRTTAVVCETEN